MFILFSFCCSESDPGSAALPASAPMPKESTAGYKTYKALLDKMCALFPEPWHSGLFLYGASIDEVGDLVREVFFSRLIIITCTGKWFKTGPPMDDVLLQSSFGNFFSEHLQHTFGPGLKKVSLEWEDGEASFLEEISFHDVGRGRMFSTLEWSAHGRHKPKLWNFAVVKEPQRDLHRSFLRTQQEIIYPYIYI